MVLQRGNDAPEKRLRGAQPLILVIDDTPADIGVLIATLAEAGYRVRATSDGESGFEQARSTTPDLILLDARMAGMDGFDTCRRLRQLPKLIETPVIFMIELSEPQDRVSAFAAGGDDFLTKPFQYQEVLARVRLHLRHHALEFELDRLYRQFDKRVAERTVELKAAITESEALRSRLQQELHALREEVPKRDNVK